MAIGSLKAAGNPPMSTRRAASPPQDAPIIASSYPRPFSRAPSADLSVDLLTRVHAFVARLVLRELQRLLAPQAEHPEPDEAVIKQRMHAVLQVLVEVDQHVSAEDHVELGE